MGDELAMGGAQSGTDIDGQIRAGIEAFQQSQDPAIAVEVVTMLAEVYGIAPQIDPYADPGMAADPYAQQVPAASNGMRFYQKGGKFIVSKKKVQSVNKYAPGGFIDPKKKPQQNPRTVPQQVVNTMAGDTAIVKPIVKIDANDPRFYDQQQFNGFYRNKAIGAMDSTTRANLNSFVNPADQDAYIALKGGLPNFKNYQTNVRAYEKTQIPSGNTLRNVARNSPTTVAPQGYQYGSRNQAGGTGRPAQGSTTRPKYENGGSIDTAPELEF